MVIPYIEIFEPMITPFARKTKKSHHRILLPKKSAPETSAHKIIRDIKNVSFHASNARNEREE
jgi:hypothetical protein